MFASYSTQINVKRTEPDIADINEAVERAVRRNQSIACIAVAKFRLKSKGTNRKKAEAKIKAAWENDVRLPYLKDLILVWNYWRDFYDPREYHKEWAPRSRASISMAENILTLVDEEGLDLNKFIACSFKAFSNSKYALTMQYVSTHGVELYSRYLADVNADIDHEETNRMAGIYG